MTSRARLAGSRVLRDTVRRRLGRDLREARTRRKLTQARVAHAVGCSQAKIQKVENGAAPIKAAELDRWIKLCGIPEQEAAELHRLAALDGNYSQPVARQPRSTAFGELVDLEMVASEIRCLHAERIPGPLQSEHYMLQVMIEVYGDIDVTEVMKARERRRAGIFDQENGPRYRAILSESALRRTLHGRPEIVVDQLEHLLRLIRTYERLELQVLPFEADILFMDSDFLILHFNDPTQPDFAYIESFGGAHRFKAQEQVERFDEHWEALHAAARPAAESDGFLSELVKSTPL